MTNPCKRDCPDRSATCHAECIKYLDFYAWCKQEREQARQQRIPTGYIVNEVRKAKSRSKAWRGKA